MALTTIVSTCPHCGNDAPDIWETLPNNEVVDMNCSKCRGAYSIYLMECHRCEAEQLFSWRHTPSAEALRLLVCEACGNLGAEPDDDHTPEEDLF